MGDYRSLKALVEKSNTKLQQFVIPSNTFCKYTDTIQTPRKYLDSTSLDKKVIIKKNKLFTKKLIQQTYLKQVTQDIPEERHNTNLKRIHPHYRLLNSTYDEIDNAISFK